MKTTIKKSEEWEIIMVISEEEILILRTEKWEVSHVREKKEEHVVVSEFSPYFEVTTVNNYFPLWICIQLNVNTKIKYWPQGHHRSKTGQALGPGSLPSVGGDGRAWTRTVGVMGQVAASAKSDIPERNDTHSTETILKNRRGAASSSFYGASIPLMSKPKMLQENDKPIS